MLAEIQDNKFHENPSCDSRVVHVDRRIDGYDAAIRCYSLCEGAQEPQQRFAQRGLPLFKTNNPSIG